MMMRNICNEAPVCAYMCTFARAVSAVSKIGVTKHSHFPSLGLRV